MDQPPGNVQRDKGRTDFYKTPQIDPDQADPDRQPRGPELRTYPRKENQTMTATQTPTRLTIQHITDSWHQYPGWNVYTLRDAVTNCHIATIGDMDRYHQDQYTEIAAKLQTAYNNFDAMKEALVKAESALFYADTDGTEEPHTAQDVKNALATVRDALKTITPNYPKA